MEIADFSSTITTPVAPNRTIFEAQTDFSINLLRELGTQNGFKSLITSPISVALALSIVYAGARDETAKQMGQVLANGVPEYQVHEYFGEILKAMNTTHRYYKLEAANKVYVKSGFELLDGFKRTIEKNYAGQLEAVDFTQSAETAKKINTWVEQKTHNRIQNLISPGMLDDMTGLVLVNAIYFKAYWANKFNSDYTEKRPFYVAESNTKQLDTMYQSAYFDYQETDQFQLLGMPYKGDQIKMFISLPKERFGIGKMFADLTGSSLLEYFQNSKNQEVEVHLPKFKLVSTHDLNNPLAKLGMPDAFEDYRANFKGITTQEPLKISKVLQKTFIELDEKGTEVAAAIMIMPMCCAASGGGLRPPVFRADHPFAFWLIRTADQRILFNGIFSGN